MPQQKRAQVTREALIVAAATVYAVRGYARTTLDTVAAEAGVTKGALYFHFESKKALADAVIVEHMRRTAERAQGVLDSDETGLASMMLLCRGLVEQLRSDVVVVAGVKLTVEESASDLEVVFPYLQWIRTIEALGEKALAEGELRPDVDPTALARFVIPAFTGVQHVSNTVAGRSDLMARIREMWVLLLPGIVRSERLDAVTALPERLFVDDDGGLEKYSRV